MAKKAIIQDAGRYRPIETAEDIADGDGNIINTVQEGEMSEYNNSDPMVIAIDGLLYGAPGLVAGSNLNGFTGVNSSTGAITIFADAGLGQVTVTSNGHGLSNDYMVTIDGTTNYDGRYSITNIQTNTFEITHSWDGNDATGNFWSGSKLIYDNGKPTLTFRVIGSLSIAPEFSEELFFWAIEKNGILQTRTASESDASDNVTVYIIPISGRIELQANDIIELVVQNVNDDHNMTIKHANINLIV